MANTVTHKITFLRKFLRTWIVAGVCRCRKPAMGRHGWSVPGKSRLPSWAQTRKREG